MTYINCAKCGHLADDHFFRAAGPNYSMCSHAGCACRVDFAALDRAVIEAAEALFDDRNDARMRDQLEDALFVAIRARREARHA